MTAPSLPARTRVGNLSLNATIEKSDARPEKALAFRRGNR